MVNHKDTLPGEKRIWVMDFGDAVLWPLPLLLSLFGHFLASFKASLSGTGPGFHIALMNERTRYAQELWHVVSQHWWVFVVYGLVLMSAFTILRVKRIHVLWRLLVLIALSIPALWYFRLCAYLSGKLLMC